MLSKRSYGKNEAINWPVPNYWDLLALVLIFAGIILVAVGTHYMDVPYKLGQEIPISLAPKHLPYYALRTVLRMFIGLFFSLVFTFTIGTWAGKSRAAERIIIPLIDILQSVPVLSFLSITVMGFIVLFRGSMLGPEAASIFAIFVAQAWNMALSFYQSVRTVPRELKEASKIFRLSAWQSFWRIDVPFGMPGLLWNMMMSMSGSWFFVTASEAISVSNHHITLPGLGSYIALAIVHANKHAILLAIFTMLVVIFLYDQLLFRPLSQWVEKFKFEPSEESNSEHSWVVDLFQKTRLLQKIDELFEYLIDIFINLPFLPNKYITPKHNKSPLLAQLAKAIYILLILGISGITIYYTGNFLINTVTIKDIEHTAQLGVFTGLRVMILIFICSIIWVPIGVWIGLRPKLASRIQPVIQFVAAFPANLLFPVMAILIVTFHLNVEIWSSPLMVLGTQWYILFNVIAGTMTLPKNLKQATATFGVTGWLKWRRLILPAIFPFYLTGAITAAGGAWNASIIAEVIDWGAIHLHATGLGSYITHATISGNFPHVALGTIMMCIFVLIINRVFWRPLYNLAIEKFTL